MHYVREITTFTKVSHLSEKLYLIGFEMHLTAMSMVEDKISLLAHSNANLNSISVLCNTSVHFHLVSPFFNPI